MRVIFHPLRFRVPGGGWFGCLGRLPVRRIVVGVVPVILRLPGGSVLGNRLLRAAALAACEFPFFLDLQNGWQQRGRKQQQAP